MATTMEPVSARAELRRILRDVRTRWRLRVALRGLAIALSATVLGALLAAWTLDRLRFDPAAVTSARVVAWVLALGLVGWFLVRPLLRRPSDRIVAHYLEEHEPSLDAAVLSAVEAEQEVARGAASPALARQIATDAVRRAVAVERGRRVERPAIRTWGAALAAALLGAALVVALAPAGVRQGLRTIFAPWQEAEAASPYAVMVEPGNITVPRGGDVEITARLRGFASEQVELAIRRGKEVEFERISMLVARDSSHVLRLFDIAEPAEYFVETNGVRSPAFRISVADLPYTKAMSHVYVFPAYTGLSPKTVEEGGDVAALRGTVVRMTITPTMRVSSGRIVVEGRDPIPLTVGADGSLTGAMPVERPGFYHVELRAADGEHVRASLDYTIDVLDDQPPSVRMVKPGSDVKVSPVEEVFIEALAEDDYGVGRMELAYSVNGGAEQRVRLHDGGAGRREVSGSHTVYLEELNVQPGDVISYYATATDQGRGGERTASTDIYFLEVRPFEREYQQAEQSGQQGGGGGDPTPGELTQQQRDVIAATFKVNRDRARLSEKDFRENVSTVALAQGRLREQVATLVRRMNERGVARDSTFTVIAGALAAAEKEMQAAEEALGRRDAQGALGPEQRALQQLQRAEAAYRKVQVQFGQQGGAGGQQQQRAEDLADLFELETDKLRNQYESVQRERQEQADQQVDEVLERLRQLAARQQQENERLRRAQQQAAQRQGGQQSGGGGASQRELAQQAEEASRQLERLSRENRSPELEEAARRLKESANAMRRSASSDQQGSASDAARALDRLQEARRLLDQSRDSRANRDAQELARRAEALAEQQRGIQRDAEKAMAEPGGLQQERLLERKDQLAGGVADLERRLDEVAREQRKDQPESARKLQEAANAIRDNKVKEKVMFSKGVVQQGSPEYARNFEEQIATNLEDVRDRVRAAAGAVGASKERQLAQALDKARDLVRGMESTDERLKDRLEGQPSADGSRPSAEQEPRQQARDGQQGQSSDQPNGGRAPKAEGRGPGEKGQPDGQGQRGGQPGGQGAPPGQPGTPGRLGGSGQGAAGGVYGAVPFSPEELRQLGRELRERRGEAEELRRELARQGVDVKELEQSIERMRQLERSGTFDDPRTAAQLHAAVLEGLKSFEFSLRRAVEGAERDRLVLGGSEEVPPGYRQLVEEYYRALARKSPK
ncbi:MAG: DUF4175 family protein [Gemmatimonadaceae bacterium]